MRIGIDIDNTLTDTNYTVIDILNRYRPRELHLNYEDFDEMKIRTIWQHPDITAIEFANRQQYTEEIFRELGMSLFASKVIKFLLKEHTIHIYSERPLEELDTVKRFLQRKDFPIHDVTFHFGITKSVIQENLLKDNIDVYIDDNPNVIKRINSKAIIPIICSHPYNENCFNYMRLECFSLLPKLIKRAEETLLAREQRAVERLHDTTPKKSIAEILHAAKAAKREHLTDSPKSSPKIENDIAAI